MGLKSTLGNAFASLLFLSAGFLTLWGLWLIVESIWVGVTAFRVMAVMFTFGLAHCQLGSLATSSGRRSQAK